MIGFELAGGSLIFLLFVVGYLFAVVHGLYTRKGSGIDEHPYGKVYSGTPGARSQIRRHDGFGAWSRGTR